MRVKNFDEATVRLIASKAGSFPLLGEAARAYLRRPFSRADTKNILLVFYNSSLAWAQFYPFFYYGQRLARAGYQFRAVEHDQLKSSALVGEASALFIQSPYEPADAELEESLSWAKELRPDIPLVYFDWAAPTDLRFSPRVSPYVAAYVKKALLCDRDIYLRPSIGHTTLVDYYTARYGLSNPPPDWTVDGSILDRLVLGPAFATAPKLLALFDEGTCPDGTSRTIDVHARIETKGTPWYSRMRSEAAEAVQRLEGLKIVTGRIDRRQYLRELRHSKICFSPFGYGEICVRDFEAVEAGAVLLKPDMGHLRTDPDIYKPWETYVPVRWDLADLEEKVLDLLSDPGRMQYLAQNAFRQVQAYLHGDSLETMLCRLLRNGGGDERPEEERSSLG